MFTRVHVVIQLKHFWCEIDNKTTVVVQLRRWYGVVIRFGGHNVLRYPGFTVWLYDETGMPREGDDNKMVKK